jgi:hypothetical protein
MTFKYFLLWHNLFLSNTSFTSGLSNSIQQKDEYHNITKKLNLEFSPIPEFRLE